MAKVDTARVTIEDGFRTGGVFRTYVVHCKTPSMAKTLATFASGKSDGSFAMIVARDLGRTRALIKAAGVKGKIVGVESID